MRKGAHTNKQTHGAQWIESKHCAIITIRQDCVATQTCSAAVHPLLPLPPLPPPPPPPPATDLCVAHSFPHTAANKRLPNHNGLRGSSDERPEGGNEATCQQEKGSDPLCAATAADQRGRVEEGSGEGGSVEGRPGGHAACAVRGLQRGSCSAGSALRWVAAGWARVTRTLIKMQ